MIDNDSNEILEFLQEKGDTFTKLSSTERKRLVELEDALAHIHAETDKYRAMAKEAAVNVMNIHVQTPHPAYKKADGNDVGRQAMLITKKVLNGLEANLNKLLQRRSEVMNSNKQKKLEIDHMRRLRIQSEIAQSKHEETLLEIKQRIEELARESADIVAQREKLVKEKVNLEKLNEEEQRVFTEQHEAMSEFIKQQNLALEDALMKERKVDKNPELLLIDHANSKETKTVRMSQGTTGQELVAMTLEEEIDMVRQVGRLTNFVHNEQNSLSSIQSRINSYEKMFDQLKFMTSATNLDDILTSYMNHEEEMFSLYTFIQSTNNEIIRVLEAKDDLKKQMKLFEQNQHDIDDSKKALINELHRSHDETLASMKLLEEENRMNQELLSQTNKRVSSLFFKLQCDQVQSNSQTRALTSLPAAKNTTAGSTELLHFPRGTTNARGDGGVALLMSQGVNENNVLEYLGCIEKRAVEIVEAYVKMTTGLHSVGSRRKGFALRRFSSPGGLSVPANWDHDQGVAPYPNINIDEVETELQADPLVSPSDDHDAGYKPIDLSVYREKLERKYHQPNGLSQSLPLLPTASSNVQVATGKKSDVLLRSR